MKALVRKAEIEERKAGASKVERTYRQILDADLDSDAGYEFRRGVVLLDLNREKDAVRIFRRLAGDTTASDEIRMNAQYEVGVALERQGKIHEAIGTYEKFIRTYSNAKGNDTKRENLLKASRWKVDKLKWIRNLPSLVTYGKESSVLEVGKDKK